MSVGGGFNYLTTSLSGSYTSGTSYTDGSGNTLAIGAPTMNLKLSSLEFEGKIQVSKTLLSLLTPYLGLTASYGTAHAEAGVNASVNPGSQGFAYWQQYVPGLTGAGYDKSRGYRRIRLEDLRRNLDQHPGGED